MKTTLSEKIKNYAQLSVEEKTQVRNDLRKLKKFELVQALLEIEQAHMLSLDNSFSSKKQFLLESMLNEVISKGMTSFPKEFVLNCSQEQLDNLNFVIFGRVPKDGIYRELYINSLSLTQEIKSHEDGTGTVITSRNWKLTGKINNLSFSESDISLINKRFEANLPQKDSTHAKNVRIESLLASIADAELSEISFERTQN